MNNANKLIIIATILAILSINAVASVNAFNLKDYQSPSSIFGGSWWGYPNQNN